MFIEMNSQPSWRKQVGLEKAQINAKRKANPSSFLLVLGFIAEPEFHKCCEISVGRNQSDSLLAVVRDTETQRRTSYWQGQHCGLPRWG